MKGKILDWNEEDRPRERLKNNGAEALKNSELLAILLGSGTKELSVVELADEILSHFNHDLERLGRASIAELCTFKGIGPAKSITLSAAMEFGRRRNTFQTKRISIKSSHSVYQIMGAKLRDLQHEEFYVLYLNKANQVIEQKCISKGGVSGTVVDVRLILKPAILLTASSAILVHNHPSGNNKPSQADKTITQKVKEAAKFIDVTILDHIIIAGNQYFSFADEGIL